MNVNWKGKFLLDERRVLAQVEMFGASPSVTDGLLCRLEGLQESIYRLDEYGETTWDVDYKALGELWRGLERQLSAFGLARTAGVELCQDVRKYQDVELRMRGGELPTRVSIATFYRLKSCDVRLARKLIESVLGLQEDAGLRGAWSLYDLVCEVCDDIEDLEEDAASFNGNRFLLALTARGRELVTSEYCRFLGTLAAKARRLVPSTGVGQATAQHVRDWTEERAGWADTMIRRIGRGHSPRVSNELIAIAGHTRRMAVSGVWQGMRRPSICQPAIPIAPGPRRSGDAATNASIAAWG